MKRDKVKCIRVSGDINRKIEKLAKEKKVTGSKLCGQIIEKYFDEDERTVSIKRDEVYLERLLRLELFFRKNFERNKDLTDAETKQINESISYLIEKIY